MTATISHTTDYDKFRFLDFNRTISPTHVRSLIESIRTQNRLHLYPILVDRDFNILDGQHRFAACKQMGIPVIYSIVTGNSDRIIIDTNSNNLCWSLKDYFKFYLSKGYPAYIELDKIMKKYNLPLGMAKSLCAAKAQGGSNSERFKEGKFSPRKTFDEVSDFLSKTENLINFLKDFLSKDRKGLIKCNCFLVSLQKYYDKYPLKYHNLLNALKDNYQNIPHLAVISEYDRFLEDLFQKKVCKKKKA